MTIRSMTMMRKVTALVLPVILAVGCASAPPKDIGNICAIFAEKEDWREYAYDSQRKWNIPVPILMAIIYRESSFRATARPPRGRLLGFIPWSRPSSAYGYPQALDPTWQIYIRSTGNRGADRDDFEDAVDFVGWYCDRSHRECYIPRADAYRLYLAYHEGQRGYNQGTYRGKTKLLTTARQVRDIAARYQSQLRNCGSSGHKKPKKRYYRF